MATRTRIKVCGLTRPDDVDGTVAAGVDAIGLVFYPPSRRLLTLDRARLLRRRVPAFVSVAALFVNAPVDEIHAVLEHVQPDLLQFHGEEPPAFCEQFGTRYLKAFRVGAPGLDTPARLAARCQDYPTAAGWLFDSYSPGFGGSGQCFDLSLLTDIPRIPGGPAFVLSGGLTADTVAAALQACRPFAVDVSSGVESEPGLKDLTRIRAFMQAVAQADAARAVE